MTDTFGRRCARWFLIAALLASLLPYSARAEEKASAAQWKPLFNGKNLDGWYLFLQKHGRNQDPDHVVTIEDGAIHAYKDAKSGSEVVMGYIGTNDSYSDYHLRLKYKWGRKQFKPRFLYKPDAGIYYHHATADLVWPQALQCQVELNGVGDLLTVGFIQVDTTINPATKTEEWQEFLPSKQGGVPYSTTGKGVTYTRKLDNFEQDGWNTVELICKGTSAAQIVNRHLANQCSNIRQLDPKDPTKSTPLSAGRILLEFEATEMFYRDVEIRPLAPEETLEQAISKATAKD
ncbi:MAG: DUF1080 domain-containing protein [Planctomycetales bacterium]